MRRAIGNGTRRFAIGDLAAIEQPLASYTVQISLKARLKFRPSTFSVTRPL